MLSRNALVALLSVLTVGSTIILGACAADDDSNTSDPTDDELKKSALGVLGDACGVKKCKTGLVCKAHSTAPPPGAMGLPAPAPTHNGPPPGAMGMPNLNTGTCSTPANGEEGGFCSNNVHCHAGLTCEFVKISSSSGGPPPGALGLPIQPHGICKATSSGPPPGALGLPIHQ